MDRIVYGAGCVWWDSISKASTNASGLPCCPHCRGVLFESSPHIWWTGIADHDAKHPGYRAKMEWARGRCFPTMSALDRAYALAIAAEPTRRPPSGRHG